MGLNTITQIFGRIVRFLLNNYFYAGALLVTATIASLLNYNGKSMGGLFVAYMDFANFFASGFDFSGRAGEIIYTFPMWGYGFILLVTKSKTIIIIFQQLVTIAILLFADYSMKKFGWRAGSRIAFRVLTIFSFPWFYFHAILWPYSQGANLLLLSLFLILHYLKFRKLTYLILASLCFGIMLNFRSDYFFLGLAIPIIILFIDLIRKEKKVWWHYPVWYAIMFILLIPWGLFSLEKTGSYLQKSSNGGHVLFISLGQLPDNKWRITPLDKDPLMRELVDSEVGPGVRTLSHQADTFLTRKWLELILNDKAEFLRKCKYNYNSIFHSPFYNGELYKLSEGFADMVIISKLDVKIQDLADSLPGNKWLSRAFDPLRNRYEKTGLILPKWTIGAIIIAFIFFRTSLFKEETFILILSVIVYQFGLMVLGYFMRGYHTNIFILYEILLVFLFIELNPFGLTFKKWEEIYNSKKVLFK